MLSTHKSVINNPRRRLPRPPARPTATTDPPGVHRAFINRAHAQQKVDTIIDAFKQSFPATPGGLFQVINTLPSVNISALLQDGAKPVEWKD